MANIKHSRELIGEKNDCTVRAYSEAFEVDYFYAYGVLLGAGRKRRKGLHFDSFMKEIHPEIRELPRPGMTVRNYINRIAVTGNWIISMRGHVIAVKEGKITSDMNSEFAMNCHVVNAWKVK